MLFGLFLLSFASEMQKEPLTWAFWLFGILADYFGKWQITRSLLPASFFLGPRKESHRPFQESITFLEVLNLKKLGKQEDMVDFI